MTIQQLQVEQQKLKDLQAQAEAAGQLSKLIILEEAGNQLVVVIDALVDLMVSQHA